MITIAIDKAGRIVVPKSIRDSFGLDPGTNLELEMKEDAIVLRRPQTTGAVMNQKSGLWVFRTGGRITPEMLEETQGDERGRGE